MDDLCSTFIFLGLYVSVCMHYTEAQSACPTQPCPPGTFCFRGTSTLCLQCNPKCVECSGPGSDECIKCETGFRLDKGSCIYSSTLPSVPAALPGQGCPSYDCPEDSYCFRGTIVVCVPCHMRCSGCTGPGADECKSCQSGYKKTAGLCTNSSIPTPVIYPPGIGCPDSPCSPLMFCFRGTKIICLECNPACYGCTGPGPDECRQCNSGYAWNSGLCIFTGQTNQVPTTGLPNNSLPGSTNTTILATGQTNQVSTTGLLNNSLPDSTTTTTLATTLPVLVTTPRAFDIFNDLSSQIHESFILVNWTINPNLVQFSWNATISYQRIGIGDCLNVSENLFGPIGIDQMNTSFRIGNPEPWSRYRITLATFGNGNITGLNSTRSIEVTSAEIVPRGLIDNFQVVTTSSTSATFNWTEVLCEYRGGRLLWYEVNVTAVNTTAVLQTLFTNVTYISVNGLAPSTHYMVSVRYVNTAGTGNSSVHYFQTSENATETTPHDSTIIQIETTLPTHDTTANAIGLFENFTYTNTNNSLLVTWSFNPSFFHISWNVTFTYQRIGIGDCQSVNESVFGPYAVGQNTSFSLGSPEPWSKYRFTLEALANGNVSSMDSTKSIEAVSAEIVPTGLIADLHVITKSSESATFNWTEVPCARRGGTLLRYEVNVTSVNTTGGSQMLQTNNTYITVIGLAPSTFYAVSVRYVNNAGASNSSVLNFQTDENVTTTVSPVPTPLAPGTEVFDTLTTANNNNALQITWNIAPGPRIYSWNITISYQRIGIGDCERVNESQLGPFLIGQGETSYSLDHPEVWSRYRFTLSARGIGVVSYITSSSSVEATSAEAAPVGVVSNFTTIRVNTTSVTLGWINVPCRQRGGQLTNFEVILKILNTTSVLKRLNSNLNSITISGLNATTYYTVSVRYINLAGAGNFSPDYVFRTLDNVTTTTTQPPQTSSSTVLIVNITTELPQTQRTILPGQKLFQVSTPVNINGTIQVKWSINASFEHDPWNISLMYQRVGIGDCDNATDNPVGPIYVRQNETSYSLTNVEPWSRYKITLTGSGNANLSNVITSESIEMVSSEVVPNGIIKDLHIINTTSTSAMIGWTDLPCNQRGGVLLGYDVEVAPVNTTGDTQSLLTNATYVAVTALKPATFYTASVRYVNSAGPGNFSEYFLFQTMENVTSRTTFAAVTETVFTNLTTIVQVSTPLTSGQNLFLNLTAVNSNGTIEVKWSLDVTLAHFSWNISLVYQKIGIGDCDNATDNSVDPIYVRQNETSYSLTNVEPWSRYKITLTGSGNANLSNVITSESIEMVSSEVVPNGIIKDLHIINTTSTSAMIGWTDLPCNQRGGVLLGYDVKVAPVNTTGDTQSLLTNATFVAVTALKPATFYTASVRYVNSAGRGNFSEYFLFQTMENVTSRTTFAAVTETVFTNLTTTVQVSTPLTSGQNLLLNLTAVNSNGTTEIKWSLDVTLAHFSWNISLVYQKIGIGDCDNATDNSVDPIYVRQNETSYSLTNVEPWSRYKITLTGSGNANLSNVITSESIEMVSSEVVPNGIIKDLHIINTTSTSAMIGWTDLPCNQRGGVLLGYDVKVAPVNTTGDTQSLLTNATYVAVTALNPATFYTASVRYVNPAGPGNFSEYFLFQTMENVTSRTTFAAVTESVFTNLTSTVQVSTPLTSGQVLFQNLTAVNSNGTTEIKWSLDVTLAHFSWNISLVYQKIGIGDCDNATENSFGLIHIMQNVTSYSFIPEPWSRYKITLSGICNANISNVVTSDSIEAVSREVVPNGIIKDLHIINTTSTSAMIGWTDLPCNQRGGVLLGYDVEVAPVNTTGDTQSLLTNETYVDVTALNPATFYTVSVRYVNSAGSGNFSDYFVFQTLENGSSSTTLTALTQTLQTNLTTTTQEPTPLIQETDIWEYMNAVPQNNSLEVTWSLSQNYRHYSWNITLIYQRIGIGDCQNVAERQIGPLALPQNSSSYSINNTMAWSKYRITLIAQRSDVISEFNSTKSTEVITSESAPEGVVSNVSIINVSSTSVTLGWTDLPCEWRGGSLLFYNVFVRPTSDISALLNLTTNSTFITVSGLTPFTSYAASVRYVNGAGAGNFSDDVIFTTSEDVPGPVDINELEPDATSIIVHINLSSPPNGKILMYNVSYSDTENFTTELLLVYNATSSETLVIRNLSSNMTYYVKVLACTSAGCGRYGNVSSVRTMEALVFGNVSSRETLKALPLESTYVTKNMSGISCIGLTWAALSQSSPASSGYNVTVRNQNDNQTVGSSVALEPNATEYVRCGLNPGDNYSLSLISYTRSLSGDVVDTVVYADQGGSQAPPAPILVNLTTTTATIRLVPIKHRTESTVVWQIKVHDVGSDGVDNGTSNIAETFSVTNIPGYVTAELYPMTATGNDVFRIGDGQEYGGYKNTPLLPGHRYAVFFIVMSVDRSNLTTFSYARMTNSITTPTSDPPSSKQSTTISTAIVHPSVNNKVDIEVLPNTATDMSWNHIPEPEPLSTSPTLIGIIVGVILLVVIIVVLVIVKLYWRFRRNRMPKSGIDQYSKHKFETLRKGDATSLANHSGRSTINDQMYTLME